MFDWTAYLDLARELAKQTDNEAALRSAISRAYYAAFGMAHRRLVQHNCQLPTDRLHHHVWATYRDANQLDCRRIGVRGFALRDRR